MYTVRDVMASPVITIEPDKSVSQAMHLMAQKEISSLLVPFEAGQYGIISKRDVVGKVVAAGLEPRETKVAEVCTTPVLSTHPATSLRECSARMVDLKVRRLPVFDDDNNLVGIVSETDIFMAVEERGWGPDQLGDSKLRAIGTLARVRRIRVEEVMSKPVAMIAHDASVSDALSRMAERGISSIVVQPQAGASAYGIVTKRDIIGRVVAQNRDPRKLRVAEIMSAPIYTIAPHVSLTQCAARMVELGVRRLTVTQNDQPVGIISDTDIFRAVEGKRIGPLDRMRALPSPPVPIRHITKSHVHTAADVMGREAMYIRGDATVSEALALMEAHDLLSLLVSPMDDGEVGIVTQRDIISKVVAEERDPDTLKVSEISSAPLITVSPSTSITECSRLMIERRIRRLPVQEGDDIIGIVRDTDIFAAVEERGWEAGEMPMLPAFDEEPRPAAAARTPSAATSRLTDHQFNVKPTTRASSKARGASRPAPKKIGSKKSSAKKSAAKKSTTKKSAAKKKTATRTKRATRSRK